MIPHGAGQHSRWRILTAQCIHGHLGHETSGVCRFFSVNTASKTWRRHFFDCNKSRISALQPGRDEWSDKTSKMGTCADRADYIIGSCIYCGKLTLSLETNHRLVNQCTAHKSRDRKFYVRVKSGFFISFSKCCSYRT